MQKNAPLPSGILWQHPAYFIALGAGIGLSRFAQGTIATIATALFYHYVAYAWGDAWMGAVFFGLLAIGSWATRYIHTHSWDVVADHRGIVIDEIAAFWLILWIVQPIQSAGLIAAILLFRWFDIVKPFGIRRFEKRYQGAFGVMGDDLLAAFYSLLLLAFWYW